jgi:protein TonB
MPALFGPVTKNHPNPSSHALRWFVYAGVVAVHAAVLVLSMNLVKFPLHSPPARNVTFVDIQTLTPPPPHPATPPPQPHEPTVPERTDFSSPRPAPAPPVKASQPEYAAQYQIDQVPVLPDGQILAQTVYPPLAARQGIQAIVFLELYIDATGHIRKIEVLKDPGYGFAQAAVQALAGVVCQPAQIEGKPVAVKFRYAVRFMLK